MATLQRWRTFYVCSTQRKFASIILDKKYLVLVLDNGSVLSKFCSKTVSCDEKFQTIQHHGRNFHKRKSAQFSIITTTSLNQSFVSMSKNTEKISFRFELCNVLISSNIPFSKLDNPTFKTFLEMYTKMLTFDRTAIRKKYVDEVFEQTMSKIKEVAAINYIYFVVDETRLVDNILSID